MIGCSGVHSVCNYAASSQYMTCPSEEQIDLGVVPLDSLPADWWNWMWHDTNQAVNEAKSALDDLVEELNTVLSCTGMQPVYECTNQLYTAIDLIRRTIGTATVAGAVKSSSACGNVSIDDAGIMTANGLGNAALLTTTNKTNVVCAINEVKTIADSKAAVGTASACALGTASSGSATTAARSDHVHPFTGLMRADTTTNTSYPGIQTPDGSISKYVRTTCSGIIPYCCNASTGVSSVGTSSWPFKDMYAKTFHGSLDGNACSATLASTATCATNATCVSRLRPIASFNVCSNCNLGAGIGCVCFSAGNINIITVCSCGAWLVTLFHAGSTGVGYHCMAFITPNMAAQVGRWDGTTGVGTLSVYRFS